MGDGTASLGELLFRRNGEGTSAAILAPGLAPMSYADAARRVGSIGARLSGMGLGREDPIALVLPNGAEMAITLLGAMATGIAAPLNPQYTSDELRFFFTDLRPALVIVDETLNTPAREVAASLGVPVSGPLTDPAGGVGAVREAQPDDVALLLHTSGTTSRPKLVPLTHANLSASAVNVAEALELRPADRCFNVMPLFHIHGIVAALLSTLASGGSIVCTPGFRARDARRWMEEFQPTWYTAVPTLHRALLDVVAAGEWRPTLRFVRSSSAALPVSLRADLECTFGVPVIEAYGMTEAAHQIASERRGRASATGGVGAAAGPDIAVVDGAGNQLPVGQPGEIVIRGPNVMTGYLDNPDANSAAFVDGWFRTGDEGLLDRDGVLTITGRLKEIINRGGEKVAPREVEDALLAHPDVSEAAVFALPHPRLGEDVGAAVVLRADGCVSTGEMRQFVAGRLAAFKLPRRIVFVTEIPKGPTGKVQRARLAATLGLDRPFTGRESEPFVAPRDATEREVARLFADILQLDVPVGITDEFIALGADSLHLVELVTELECEFQRPVPAALFLTGATPERLAEFLRDGTEDVATIVPIQPNGSRPPLFCVMRAATLVSARHFASALGPDQPIFGVWMPAMHGSADAAGGIEEIAATCRRLIAEAGASPPYYIFGYSLGGLVAYEMARQSEMAGEPAGLVIMADTPFPRPFPVPPTFRDHIAKLLSREGPPAVARRVRRAIGRVQPPSDAEVRRATERRALAERLGPSVDLDASVSRERTYVAVPRPATSPVVLLRCRQTMAHLRGSPALGWEPYVRSDWEFHDVPGSHDSMLGEPHIHALAATVASSLQRAQQAE